MADIELAYLPTKQQAPPEQSGQIGHKGQQSPTGHFSQLILQSETFTVHFAECLEHCIAALGLVDVE